MCYERRQSAHHALVNGGYAFNFFSFEKFQHDSSENTVYVCPLGRQL